MRWKSIFVSEEHSTEPWKLLVGLILFLPSEFSLPFLFCQETVFWHVMMKNAARITVAKASGWKKWKTTHAVGQNWPTPQLVSSRSIDRRQIPSLIHRYAVHSVISALKERIIPCVSLSLFVGVDQKREKDLSLLDWRSFLSCVVVCYTFQLQRDFLRNNETARERNKVSFRRGHTRKNFVWSPVFFLSPVLQFLSGKWISLSLQFIHLLERDENLSFYSHTYGFVSLFLSRLMVSFTKIDRLTFFLLAPSIHFLCQIL